MTTRKSHEVRVDHEEKSKGVRDYHEEKSAGGGGGFTMSNSDGVRVHHKKEQWGESLR